MRSIKPELESFKKIKLHLNNVWDLPGFTAESCPPSRRQYSPGKISGAGQSYKTSGNLHPRKANKEGTRAILTCRAIKTWAFTTEQVTQFKYQSGNRNLDSHPEAGMRSWQQVMPREGCSCHDERTSLRSQTLERLQWKWGDTHRNMRLN